MADDPPTTPDPTEATAPPVVLTLEVTREEVPVRLPDGKMWSLRGLTEKEKDQWLDKRRAAVKVDARGNPVGLPSVQGVGSSLVSMCLCNEEGKLVPQAYIDSLPAKTVQKLVEKCIEMNALDLESTRKAQEDAKKN